MANNNVIGEKGLSANLLPKFYQTIANKKFLQSTVDQLFQPGTLTKTTGYIGRENAKASTGADVYVKAADAIRQNYQLEPGITVTDNLGNVTFFKDYVDYINQINVFGGNTKNHNRLNKQEFYSWDPHIDWDKFVNFQNYYWLPYGPDTITVYGPHATINTTYNVKIQSEGANNQYIFTPDGATPDPVLKLYRGVTYTFNISSPGNPFSFKTVRSLGTDHRYSYLTSIDNYGVTSGTVTFTVPENAPSILFYQSETDINLGGVIEIFSINADTTIDVASEILGKSSVTLPDGTVLSNGMKLAFGGNVTPAEYANGQFYVEGVGIAIKLIPETVLEVVSTYSTNESIPFDSVGFDKEPWETATGYAGSVDYITINRASRDHNPWSRYNRWFHQDVINASAVYNNNTPILDQTSRATRPIIEFQSDLRLFNFGTKAIIDVDILDNTTGNTSLNKNAIPVFTAIEGQTGYNEPTTVATVSIALSPGMLVLFTGDPDPLVQNKIFRVEYLDVKHLNGGSNQLHLVEVATPELDQVVLVKQGKFQGQMFWFNGTTWIQAQQKTTVNQPPLFDIFDSNGVSVGDTTVYNGSTFIGTRVFSYKQGSGSADNVLGFPLSYQNVSNIGDIVFNFNLVTDTFEYKKTAIVETQKLDSGFLSILDYAGNTEYVNGWQTCKVDSAQAAIRIYKNSGLVNNFRIDIYDDINSLSDLVVRVYINGKRLDPSLWTLTNRGLYKNIRLTNSIALTDVLTIKAFSAQPINSNGYYEIPVNLQNNPLNAEIGDFTLGEVINHVDSIIDNLYQTVNNQGMLTSQFVGVFPGDSDLRNLGNVTPYGTKFVQHSGPLSLGIYHTTSETNNIIKAIEQSREDYNNFKRNFISTATNLGIDGDPVTIVNQVLQKLNADKPHVAPYYFSDMVPYGACVVTDLTVIDHRIRQYPLSAVFTLDTLSNKAVGVYLNGVQLIHGQDYTFSNQGFVIIDSSVSIINGDTISTYEYDSTDGCFVPSTPSKLGMWPVYAPKIYTDTALVDPQTVIQGHDGSVILAYGDYRDELLLELEKRIFNNIKVKYDTDIFDITDFIPSYNRSTDYNVSEFNEVLAPNFYKWTSLVGKDLTTPLNYDRTNSFTYNYSFNTAPDGTGLPGYWRGVYRWLLDTDRPNICPWEMLGFSIQPSWWIAVYGPAPYTSNNLPMWQDIAAGIVRQPGVPIAYKPKFAKPFLVDRLPVDEFGNLISPQQSGLATGMVRPRIDNNFVFGDGSPVESAWARSSYYPFSVIIASILLTPAKSFGILLDRSRISRNVAGQLVYSETGLRIKPSDIVLPSVYSSTTRVQTAGLVNYIVDLIFNYIFSNNIVGYNSYATDLATMDVKLSYRVGAFTNKSQFNLLLESKTPSSSGNVFVPTEDYSVFLNKSSSVEKLVYSGVVVTKLSTGFEIKGYSITQPYFKYYAPKNTGVSINVGGISENFVNWSENQTYTTGTIVQYGGKYYRTISMVTSSTSFDSTEFVPLSSLPITGGANAYIRTGWDKSTTLVAPYGTLFATIQDVVDFLIGYGENLKDQGFTFDDFNNNLDLVANWETSAREFLFWTTQNWSSGQDKWSDWAPNQPYTYGSIVRYEGDYYSALTNIAVSSLFDSTKWSLLPGLSNVGSSVISLSPSANGINFTTNLTVVDSITNKFNPYEIFKVDGTPLEVAHIDSYRQENNVTYSPRTTDGIYGAAFYLVQNEHVVVINNSTIFNDVIYNPASGYRQERLKVSGYITNGWYGGLDIPGFIFDAAAIELWQPYKDYNSGDIISYQNYYYSANKFIAGESKFTASNWTQLSGKPTSQILPNWTNSATQFRDFYSLEVDSFDTAQQQMAQHLIGYQKRQYLHNIVQDDVSEFKFYQGMIREKGTQNVLNKLFDVLSSDAEESLTFYEEWALRVGQYGAANAFDDVEFILDQGKFNRSNPQATVLVNSFDSTINPFVIQQTPNDVYVKPLGYESTPFPVVENFQPFLRSAGYVNTADVFLSLGSISQLTSQTVDTITSGVYYVILSVGTTDFTQLGATSNTAGISFKASSAGIGTGTVSVDVTQVNEGAYIWCAFDNTFSVNSWNVYRLTDVNIRVENLTYSNNVLTITCQNLVKLSVGSYIGLMLDTSISIKGLNGFFKITSVKLNTFTVSATVTGLPTQFNNAANLIVYSLVSQRSNSIDTIDTILPKSIKSGNFIWTDDSGDGKWASWIYNPVYKKSSISNVLTSNNLQFGRNIAMSVQGNIAAVSMQTGQISTYDKIGRSVAWTQRQYIQVPFIANNNVNAINTIATTLAISADGSWLATGSPAAGFIATRYVGPYNSSNTYSSGDIVSYSDMYYKAVVSVPTNQTPNTASYYWNLVFYIPVDLTASNSILAQQGVISLYKKDANNLYQLVDSIISPIPSANENFGSSLVFDDNNLFIGASGYNNSTGRVYKLTYNTVEEFYTFYDDIGSSGKTIKVLSSAGIVAGQSVNGTGFTKGQLVDSVLTRLVFTAISGLPGYIRDTQNNNVPITSITAGTIVSGTGIFNNTSVVSAGTDVSGKSYILVRSVQDLAPTISTIILTNGTTSFNVIVNSVVSAATIILTQAPDSTPSGKLTFSTTAWQYSGIIGYGDAINNFYGSHLSLSLDGSTLLVSASGGHVGKVYIYRPGTTVQTITGLDNSFGSSTAISSDGDYIAISNELSATSKINEHGTVGVYKLTNNQFVKIQDIRDHYLDLGSNFGTKVAFMNNSSTLVVYSENAAGSIETTIDVYSVLLSNSQTLYGTPYVNSTDLNKSLTATTFDKESTKFTTTVPGSGRIDIYDRYNTTWVYSESIVNEDQQLDGFGLGFAVGNNNILVGSPLATVKTNLNSGLVYAYTKSLNALSWTKFRSQIDVVDISKLKKSFLYNRINNELVTYLDVIDPIQGKIAGPADEEIKYKTFYDPAVYSYSDGTVDVTVSNGTYWSNNQLGQLWWDLRTTKFVTPYFADVAYRNNIWNQLAPGASVDVYEWISTNLTPNQWDAQADTPAGLALGISGTSLYGNSVYTVRQRYNSVTQKFVNTYYYWVKNKALVPTVAGRQISAQAVSNLISNPKNAAYTYMALIGKDSFSLVNAYQYLSDTKIALAVEYWNTDSIHRNIHSQWKLISTDTSVDLPHTIEQKWIDSLCGVDTVGRPVPDINLPFKLKYGIENRPRQGMFINRVEALKEFVEAANIALAINQIVKNYNLTGLESYDAEPNVITGLYDTTLDTSVELSYVNTALFQRAILVPIITNGNITGINVVNSGKGYLIAPYVSIIGPGKGAVVRAIIDTLGRIVNATIISPGYGYDSTTTCSVRDYSVLVHSDSQANGAWSIYSFDPTYIDNASGLVTGLWSRILTQSYDVRNYWTYIDWYGSYSDATNKVLYTATQFTAADHIVQTYADLNSISVSIGEVVKVATVNTGGWELLYKYADSTSIDWTLSYSVVGIQNGTIQLSSSLYQTDFTAVGYDASIYDGGSFDVKAATELRLILTTLKNDIFINTLKGTYLDLFFRSVRYAHSEQLYLDWIFKTSFVRATHNVGALGQPVYYPIDNLSNFQNYVDEVKPYKTKIREYISDYTALDTAESAVTDFDLPPVYTNNQLTLMHTQVVNEKINVDSTQINTYPWKFWADNTGYTVTELKIVDGGSGYITEPQIVFSSSSGSGATAVAYFTNGVINRLILLTSGRGYLSAPTVSIIGGLGIGGVAARAIAIIGDGVVRSNLVGIKFDRLTYGNYITDINVTTTHSGSGSLLQFSLEWAPDIRVGQSTVTIDNVLVLRELYTLSIVSSIKSGYTQYSGIITFTSPPTKGSAIVITYKKDVSLLNAADRIEFFYNPVTGELGKDLNQLMTGIDYGGTIVGNLGFNTGLGWGEFVYATQGWDTFDPAFNDYIVTVDAGTSFNFTLPYTPAQGTEINVYYTEKLSTSVVSDGVQLMYPFSVYLFPVEATIQTILASQTPAHVTVSTNVANPTLDLFSISTNVQASLVAESGTAGQSTIVFSNVLNVVFGQYVSGVGVEFGTTVSGYTETTVILSNNLFLDATGSYTFFSLGKILTVTDTSGIGVGMGIVGNGFNTQYVTKIQNSTTLYISTPPSSVILSGESLIFSGNVAGSTTLYLNSVANINVNDVVTCSQNSVLGYNTTVVSIDAINSAVELSQILYSSVINDINFTFSKVLQQPTDASSFPNGTLLLTNPVPAGSTLVISGYPAVGIRIDAEDFDPNTGISQTNPNAIMPSVTISRVSSQYLTVNSFADGSTTYTINVPLTYAPETDGSIVIIRQSTSDGTIAPVEVDTYLTSGDLNYSNGIYLTASGISADDIVMDGDGFVTTTTSPAPEEVVPGQVVDALAVKVYDRPTSGSAKIDVENYIASGSMATFNLKESLSSKRSIIVKVDNAIQTLNIDYTVDYETQSITFDTTPSAGQVVTIFNIGYAGENILDIDYFVGNGVTTEFITKAPWLDSVSSAVYINGVASNVQLFKTDNSYLLSNLVGIRFINAPTSGVLINYIIVSGNQPTFAITNTETIAANGNTSYTLAYPIGETLPDEPNMIVRVNQQILPGPVSVYFTIASNRLTYTIDNNRVPPYTVSAADVVVTVSGVILVDGKDYVLDLGGVSIKITKEIYKQYSGKQIVISVNTGQGYTYNPSTRQITFSTPYSNTDIVEVFSAYRHDTLDLQRTAITVDSSVNLTPDSMEFYSYQSIIGGTIVLDRSVLNESYIWVVKNTELLTPGVDYKLNDDHTSIQLALNPDITDTITLITFGSNIIKSGISYMQFKDILNRTSYKRLNANKRSKLVTDLHWNSTSIELEDATNFETPAQNLNIPGVVEIRGERIEYFGKIGNILINLRRGTLGTGINTLVKTGNFVQDIGRTETIPYQDSVSTSTIVSNGTNTVPLGFVPKSVNEIEVFVGGYDISAVWASGVEYSVGTVVNNGSYTYRCITAHTSGSTFSLDSANWAFFIGNIRLKKESYKVFNVNVAPYSPAGDVTFPADFSVDGATAKITLTNLLSIGTQITVVKTTGVAWDNASSILYDDSKIAQFLKDAPGIWYSSYKT
jgi:hypothetical protein